MWQRYKHRFVPWIALNLNKRARRIVNTNNDKIIEDKVILATLLKLLPHLHKKGSSVRPSVALKNLEVMVSVLGFSVVCGPSKLQGGGTGVFMAEGCVGRGTVICFYPGTIYRIMEPVFFPSLGNKFVFRCLDGLHVDGNDRGLSKMIYKSCVQRDSVWPHAAADLTWLSGDIVVPWNIGQYVNNQNQGFDANVAYQEFDISLLDVPHELHCLLPNIWYSGTAEGILRLIALVSTRNISKGEEILSNYYTLVTNTKS